MEQTPASCMPVTLHRAAVLSDSDTPHVREARKECQPI